MKPVKNILISGAAALLSVITALVIFYGHITAAAFSTLSDTDISYKQVRACSINELIFKGLSVIQRKDGMGVSAVNGSVKFALIAERRLELAADFALNDVRFIRAGSPKESSMNSIDGLIAAPFSSFCKYATVSGNISAIKNGMRIRNFLASSDTIRFSLDGTLTEDNVIDASITIYFADSLIGNISPELSSMILKGDSQGWRSLSFRVQGDLAKPSINVTGKLFRLNIGLK